MEPFCFERRGMMNWIRIFLLASVGLLSGAVLMAKETPDLSRFGSRGCQIVLPDGTPNPDVFRHLKIGADMLSEAFKETYRMEVPVVAESKLDKKKNSLFIGDTRELRSRLGIDPGKYPDYSFVIAEDNGDIFIVGEDKHRFGKLTTPHYLGTKCFILGSLKGCVYFAEKFLHVRFLYPGDIGIDYDKTRDTLEIPENLRLDISSPVRYGDEVFRGTLYEYSNNHTGPGAIYTYGGHSHPVAVPAAKYSKEHPEYFMLRGGKRDWQWNHVCLSNPEVQELIYQEMLARLDDGAEIVQLGQNDAYQQCECANCENLFGVSDPAEQLWILHRNLALRLLKDRPGKKVIILCYAPCWLPPKTFSDFPSNVMIELCRYSEADFEIWSKIKVPGGFTTYVYNWGNYNQVGVTPKRTPEFCAEQARLFLKNKVLGVFRCGFGENFGLEAPSYYVYGKMFDDPGQDYEKLVDEFYRRAYHEAYVPMRKFHEILFKRLHAFTRLQCGSFGEKKGNALPDSPLATLAMIYSPDILDIMSKNLDRAEKIALDPKVRKRLELVRMEFTYVSTLAKILHLYNAYRLNPTWTNFEQMGTLIEERNAFISRCYGESKRSPIPFPGWSEMSIFNTITTEKELRSNGLRGAVIGSPLNWNIKALRDNKILPGVGKKSLTAIPARGEVSDTDFQSGAWKNADWNELGEIQLGSLREHTRFKVIYDQEKLIFGVESELNSKKEINAFGHDGNCFLADSLELFIDPTGTRSVYYHFILGPVPNSYYEASCGLITDVLHPLYNKPDSSWDGKWNYRSVRKGDKWFAIIEIPFASLSASLPTPGSRWLFNLGREAYFSSPYPELSLWSPNFQNQGFHDMEAFGEMLFQ